MTKVQINYPPKINFYVEFISISHFQDFILIFLSQL